MAGNEGIPKVSVTRNAEVGVKTIAEFGGGMAMVFPERLTEVGTKTVTEFVRRHIVPFPKPSALIGLARWGSVCGLASMLHSDTVPQFLRELEGDLDNLERRIQKEEQELDDLLGSPAHTVITNPEQAAKNNKRILEKLQALILLNQMRDLLVLKIEKQTLLANGGSDVELSNINAKIHYLEMTLTETIQSQASTQQKTIGIVASAGSGSDAPPPAGGGKKTDDKKADDAAEPVVDVASFVVKDWGVEIKLNIRDGVLSADAINTIDVFSKVFPEKEGVARFSFQVTDTLPEQIADWGFAFMDRSHKVAEALKVKLTYVNFALKQGGELAPVYLKMLKDVDDTVNALLAEFTKERATLEWVKNHLGGDAHDEALKKAIKVALHDAQNSLNQVQELMVPIAFMTMGRAVDDARLNPAPNISKSSLYGVVRAGLAQVTVELEREEVTASIDDPIFAQVAFQLSPKKTQRVVLILQNLIGNGGRYSDPMKETKTVSVTGCLLADGSFEVTVTDNGIGVPASILRHLGAFEYQTGQKAVEGSSGKGVNSVIQTLKELGWGSLQIKSVEGEGSSFRFIIPPQAFKVSGEVTTPVVHRTSNDVEPGFIIPDAAIP